MPQPVDIITVPWDSGRRDWRMGAGPAALLDMGLARTLEAWGHEPRLIEVEPGERGPIEIVAATMALLQATSQAVRASRSARRFPLVLAGNCMTTVGALTGARGEDASSLAVAWLDAHGDLNTPETSPSGFLDGMAAATLLGWCYHAEAGAVIDGFGPLPAERFLLLGARDLDPGELEATTSHRIRLLSPDDVASERSLEHALDHLLADAAGVWVHVDLDVLDPAPLAPANVFTPPGGLSLYHAIRAVQECAARAPVAGLTLSAYDPTCDPDGLLRAAALPLVAEVLGVEPAPGEEPQHGGPVASGG